MKRKNDKKLLEQHLIKLELDDIFDKSFYELLDLHIFDIHETVFNEEDEIRYLYVLLEGQIGVTPYSEKGKYSILDIVLPGDIIGDIEYFNGDRYYYQVMALTPCMLLAIPVDSINKFFSQNVDFYRYTSRNLAKKMKRTSHKYSRTMLYPLKNRLAKYLYELYEIQGNEIEGIKTALIADYFGISPRHLRRVLGEIESEGIIKRDKTAVKVLDLGELKKLATYI